ncbi:MAG: TonB-dependent receptor [Bergeyella zoohelcum]|nr:TonB-dependent receptor [Bergeyella zoohelcum]
MSLSTDYQYNKLDANLPSFAFPTRHTEMIALASQWRLWQKLKLQASILGTFIQERVEDTKFSNPAPAKQEYSPALFFSYEPLKSKTLKIHGFYKNIFRMPTFNDLYYSEIGFSNLKPEYTEQWDLGISFSKDFSRTLTHFNLTADVYHHISKDKIVAFPRGQQFRWTMLNLGKVDAKCVDISAQSIWLIARNLILNNRLSYTYEEAIDITNPEDFYYKHQIPYIPKHSGSMVLGLIYKDWAVNYSFLYTGKRHNMQANILSNFEQPWYTSDISIFREIPMKKMKIRAGLEVNNLFNQYYSVIRNFPMPGTNYRASLKIQF